MTDTLTPHDRELIARIDQLQTDADAKRQGMRYELARVVFAGMTAGAAIFAAGGALVGLILKFHG